MIELGALLLVAVAVLGLVVAAGVIVKTLLWLVFLPIRLAFWLIGGLLILPLLLFKLVAGILFLIALPFLAIIFGVVTVAVAASLLIPAIPLILLIALVWYLVRPEPHLGTGGA